MSIRVFISYAHADQELYEKLQEHLSSLKHSGKVTIWQDQEILAGADWEDQITTHLNEADIILLLISSSFIASEYCWYKETQIALGRHEARTATVIPVILKPTDLQGTPLKRLHALPTRARPVTDTASWNSVDAAFEDVVRGIRKVVEHLPTTSQPEKPATHPSTVIQKRERPRRRVVPILLILFVLIGSGGGEAIMWWTGQSNSPCATAPNRLPASAHGIGVVKTDAGECIGLSDGTVAFDVNQSGRTDSALKQRAAAKLAARDRQEAINLLQQAVKRDESDAEARIYLENLQVQNMGQPYITLIIGTKITGDKINPIGERNNLRGAYIAQQEHNNNCTPPHCIPVRLLIANTGNDANNAQNVAQQIKQAAQSDQTIIGVEGWPFSQDSVNMVSILTAARVPMVSSSASSDSLTGISPYFFRVSPPDCSQGALGANYAMTALHAHRIALFVDPSNAYSSSLANAFNQHIISGSVNLETYTVGTYAQDKGLARTNLQDVSGHRPDLIYFAGYPKDAAALFEELKTYKQLAQIPVMGGDALGDLVGDPSQNVVGLDHLVFTDFAAPDEWHYRDPSVQQPLFFQEYIQTFASGGLHSDGMNGDNSPSAAAMLSYDALRVLLQASQTAFARKNAALTGQDLQQALTNITGSQAFQGVSGQIAFGQDGNPQDKAVVILNVDKQGMAHILNVGGTFA